VNDCSTTLKTWQTEIPEVLVALLVPLDIPDGFVLDSNDFGSIRCAPILYANIQSGLKAPKGPSIMIPFELPLGFYLVSETPI